MSFWSTCHRLELAIKYSVGAELLRDIKERLMELYHLYKKSSKKLCSFEDLKEITLKILKQYQSMLVTLKGLHFQI